LNDDLYALMQILMQYATWQMCKGTSLPRPMGSY